MKLLLLQPRLDCTFKRGPVPLPSHLGTSEAILGTPRLCWREFFDRVKEYCKNNNHSLEILEKPLWQFEPSYIDDYDIDYALVPHKGQNNFPHKKALY